LEESNEAPIQLTSNVNLYTFNPNKSHPNGWLSIFILGCNFTIEKYWS